MDWAQGELLGIDHFEDAIVSTSNYKMPFPKIYREGIKEEGGAPMEQEVKGLKVEVSEDKTLATISYNGKDAEALKADNLYMVVYVAIITDGVLNPDVKWEPISNYEAIGISNTAEGKTTFNLVAASSMHVDHLQFGICNADADNATSLGFGQYSDKHFANSVVAKTEKAFVNENVDPTLRTELRGTPDLSLISLDTKDGEQPKTITVQYGRELAYDNDTDTEPIITFTAIRTADGAVVDVGDWASISNVKVVDDKHISFVFRPSISYSHNEITYKFHLENMHCVRLNGETGKPSDFSIEARRTSIVCNRVFGGGKLYIEAFSTPTLVDNSDLSMNGWTYTDKDGEVKKVSQSERSQLALVVKTPANKEQLENKVTDAVGADNVMNMATYELDLNICSRIASIPEGSFLKLSFGFPDGITADMEGVEFEVYHFKKNPDGSLNYDQPEVLNCVVTKYGLTVTVDSFSPFVIVAREKTTADNARRGILTALNGMGGTVTANTGKPVNFLSAEGESVTYTLTPDEGYTVEYVMLNGKELTVTDNKVTVNYADLTENDNILNIGFASSAVLAKEQEAGETNAVKTYAAKTYNEKYEEAPKFDTTTPDNPVKPNTPTTDDGGLTGGQIALIVIAVVFVIGAAGFCVWYFALKKKKQSSEK